MIVGVACEIVEVVSAVGHQCRVDKLVQNDFVTRNIPISFRRSKPNKPYLRAQHVSTEFNSPLKAIISPRKAWLYYMLDPTDVVCSRNMSQPQ